LELGSNKTICEGESIALTPTINATGGVVYRWNTGATSSSLNVNQSGVYKLTISQASCSAIDSLKVRVNPLPAVLPDEITCQDKPLIASSPDSNLTYLWELSGEKSRAISVAQDGVYKVKITNQFGCSKTRIFTVAGPCSASILAPDIFTPNGDGINDTFKLFISGGTPIKLIIYNRWGNPVFSSTDSNPEWDGKLKGEDVLNGTYAYILHYKTLTSSATQKYWGVVHIER
jgi:gliding motility-associated-like protein